MNDSVVLCLLSESLASCSNRSIKPAYAYSCFSSYEAKYNFVFQTLTPVQCDQVLQFACLDRPNNSFFCPQRSRIVSLETIMYIDFRACSFSTAFQMHLLNQRCFPMSKLRNDIAYVSHCEPSPMHIYGYAIVKRCRDVCG